jgi:kynurenine formamidase
MVSLQPPSEPRRTIDITAPLREGLTTWPGVVDSFHCDLALSLDTGDAMTVSRYRLGAHTGTRVDAPCRFLHNAGVSKPSRSTP